MDCDLPHVSVPPFPRFVYDLSGRSDAKPGYRITSYNVCYTKLLRFPPPFERSAQSSFRSLVADFLEYLCADDACPVCREMSRAWSEWMDWLTDNLPRDMEVRDLLPVCPTHLQAAFRPGNRRLAVASIRNVLHLACSQVRLGIATLSPPPVPDRKKSLFRPGRLFQRDKELYREACRSLGRPLPCPVCHRLAVARDRAILLFVITSYSIHYTKLYDARTPRRPTSAWRRSPSSIRSGGRGRRARGHRPALRRSSCRAGGPRCSRSARRPRRGLGCSRRRRRRRRTWRT